jgi:hypothetical protein
MPVYIMNGAPGDPGGTNPLGVAGANTAIVSGTAAVSGNNTLIAAPAAGYRITVYALYVQNESAVVTTIILRDFVARWRALLDQYDWFILYSPWRLNEAAALTLNLSGANSHGYSVQYAIEPV